MMRALLTSTMLGASLLVAGPAVAKKNKGLEASGIPLEVQVLDADTGEPVKTAKVRNPQEKEPHPVNADTGIWKGDVLYLPDGTEVFFDKGMVLTFEISAPSYRNQKITYEMRKRKNKVVIPLEKMELDIDDIEEEDPVIQFGRDKPIGGRPVD